MSKSKKIICELIDFDNEIYTRQQLAEFRAFFPFYFCQNGGFFYYKIILYDKDIFQA